MIKDSLEENCKIILQNIKILNKMKTCNVIITAT